MKTERYIFYCPHEKKSCTIAIRIFKEIVHVQCESCRGHYYMSRVDYDNFFTVAN